MNTQFTYLLRVRYAECDAQQVVFNAKYVEYVDVALFEYFRSLWGDYKYFFDQGLDAQVVNVNVSWKAPAVFDDVIALGVQLKKIGNSSFSFDLSFSNYRTKQQLAFGEITYVLVSMKEHNKTAIPPDMREKLEAGTSDVINHAGIEIVE